MPGNGWLRGFVKGHNLTKHITDNVKAARTEVNHEVINKYFFGSKLFHQKIFLIMMKQT